MQLLPLQNSDLNSHGLPDYPWIIADPENTRYTLNTHSPALICHNHKVIGFLTQKKHSNLLHVAYLIFLRKIENSTITQFCNTFIHGPTSITTYDVGFHENTWRNVGFQINPGQIWMELKINSGSLLKTPVSVQQITWSNNLVRIESIYHRCFPQNEWCYFDDFKKDPSAGSAIILMAKVGANDAGFCLAISTDDNTCFICWLGVLPEYRGKGVGQDLFSAAMQLAAIMKQKKMTLLVRPDNKAAVRFYRKQLMQQKWQRINLIRK